MNQFLISNSAILLLYKVYHIPHMIPLMQEAIGFATQLVILYIILMILPIFLRMGLNFIIAVIAFFIRIPGQIGTVDRNDETDAKRKKQGKKPYRRYSNKSNYYQHQTIRNFLAMIFLPGTVLRIALVTLFLRLRGWNFQIGYPTFVGKLDRSLLGEYSKGFYINMKPGRGRQINLKDILIVSMIGYVTTLMAYSMWINRIEIMDFLIYIQQGKYSIFWIKFIYYYLFLAILIGGAPIPEETLFPIYYVLIAYVHVIVGIVFAFIAGFALSLMQTDNLGFTGERLGHTYFLLLSTIIIIGILVNQKNNRLFSRQSLDETLLNIKNLNLL